MNWKANTVRRVLILLLVVVIISIVVNKGIHNPLWLSEHPGESGISRQIGNYLKQQYNKYFVDDEIGKSDDLFDEAGTG